MRCTKFLTFRDWGIFLLCIIFWVCVVWRPESLMELSALWCAVGKGRGWLMPASSLMMEIVVRQSWYVVQSTMGGRSELVVVDGAMNRHRYIQILKNQMLPWAKGVFGRNFVYVQDNAPPHTARDTVAFLDQQDVEVMDWPARSLDMNPIEHVWDQMSVWIWDMDGPPSTIVN